MEFVIARRFENVPRFRRPEGGATPPAWVPAPRGEDLIGWYQNPAPWQSERLALTDTALYAVSGNETTRIAWDEVEDAEPLGREKATVSGVRVRTQSGDHTLRMAGTYGPGDKYSEWTQLLSMLLVVARANDGASAGAGPG